MITSLKLRYGLLWLTSFLVTGGVWGYVGNHAFAQNAGTITINTDRLIITDGASISVNAGSITLTPPDSVPRTSGGNISINTGNIILVRRVPEPSSTLGLLAFAVGVTTYRSKSE